MDRRRTFTSDLNLSTRLLHSRFKVAAGDCVSYITPIPGGPEITPFHRSIYFNASIHHNMRSCVPSQHVAFYARSLILTNTIGFSRNNPRDSISPISQLDPIREFAEGWNRMRALQRQYRIFHIMCRLPAPVQLQAVPAMDVRGL